MSAHKPIPRPPNSPLHEQRRAGRILDKLVYSGVHPMDGLDLPAKQKVEHLLKIGFVEQTPSGLRITRLGKRMWIEERGSNQPWRQLPPLKRKEWTNEYLKWFEIHKSELLKNCPPA